MAMLRLLRLRKWKSAEVGEEESRGGAGHDVPELQYPYAVEGERARAGHSRRSDSMGDGSCECNRPSKQPPVKTTAAQHDRLSRQDAVRQALTPYDVQDTQ